MTRQPPHRPLPTPTPSPAPAASQGTVASPGAAAYLRTKVLTVKPEELRLMLLDGAIRFLQQGRDGLTTRNFEAVYEGFSKCRDIILELINSIRHDVNPPLAARVTGLYTYMLTQLIEAGSDKDLAKVDNVLKLLDFERQTWVMLMEKVAAERNADTADAPTQEPSASAPARASGRTPQVSLSVQG